MFKRLFWLCVGVGLGVGLAFKLSQAARRAAERYTPESVAGRMTEAIRQLGREIRAAAQEGVTAMQEREAELRSQLDTSGRFVPGEVVGDPYHHN